MPCQRRSQQDGLVLRLPSGGSLSSTHDLHLSLGCRGLTAALSHSREVLGSGTTG